MVSISSLLPSAKPIRRPANPYDLEKVRSRSTLSCRSSSGRQEVGAKSTYASSIATTPDDTATAAATSPASNNAPVGELGLTMNLSGAGSGPRLGGSSANCSVGCVEGTASWIRQSGSRSGYVGVG